MPLYTATFDIALPDDGTPVPWPAAIPTIPTQGFVANLVAGRSGDSDQIVLNAAFTDYGAPTSQGVAVGQASGGYIGSPYVIRHDAGTPIVWTIANSTAPGGPGSKTYTCSVRIDTVG